MASITTYRLHPSIYLKPRLILSKSEPEAPEGACASICISSNYIDLFEVALILLAFALFVSSSSSGIIFLLQKLVRNVQNTPFLQGKIRN
jgi:hypothetical protein